MFFLNFWTGQTFWPRFQYSAGAANNKRRKAEACAGVGDTKVNKTLMASEDRCLKFVRYVRLEAFALDALALHLAGAAYSLGGFAGAALGGFFVMPAKLHFAEHAFTLKFLFQRLQRLIDVVITNENLHLADNSCWLLRLKNKNTAQPEPAAHALSGWLA